MPESIGSSGAKRRQTATAGITYPELFVGCVEAPAPLLTRQAPTSRSRTMWATRHVDLDGFLDWSSGPGTIPVLVEASA